MPAKLYAAARQRIANFIYPEGVELRDRAEREANIDALTGAANYRALSRALRTAEEDASTMVVLFDMNNFGKVNKLKGHECGNAMLREAAAAIRFAAERFNLAERVFRVGGDEFVVLAPSSCADAVRDMAEGNFGERKITTDLEDGTLPKRATITLTGTVAKTFAGADAILQSRKVARKTVAG